MLGLLQGGNRTPSNLRKKVSLSLVVKTKLKGMVMIVGLKSCLVVVLMVVKVVGTAPTST